MMRLLTDEHVPPLYRTQLLRRNPELTIWRVGSVGTPPFGTPDPAILVWCEEHGFVLLTNNRKSMPVHLAAHVNAGRHVPGILTIDLDAPIGVVLEEVLTIAMIADDGEYMDRIVYIPLR